MLSLECSSLSTASPASVKPPHRLKLRQRHLLPAKSHRRLLHRRYFLCDFGAKIDKSLNPTKVDIGTAPVRHSARSLEHKQGNQSDLGKINGGPVPAVSGGSNTRFVEAPSAEYGGVSCNSMPPNQNQIPISKIASFQQFIPHDYDASDHATSSFPVVAVHRIGMLDVRTFNIDRHARNLLVRKHENGSVKFGGQVELIPIDHGLYLSETLNDPYFEWIHWPQTSIPFSNEELEYIANLDPVRDSDMLRMELPIIREACLWVLVHSTHFLKEAAASGLCLAEVGDMMSRQFTGRDEEPSEIEVMCIEARRLISKEEVFLPQTDIDEQLIEELFFSCNTN